MTMKLAAAGAVCDLCHHHQPSLYCSSDSAFLCFHCDSQVHTANFLVARHIRVPICKSYHSNDDDDDDDDALSSSSSSSVCISNKTNSKTTKSADWKTREVLVSWCSRLGGCSSSVIEAARRAFKAWWVNRSRSEMECPYRVGLAASLWLGLTKDVHDMKKRIRLLKRLEEISGVSAKSIVLEQSKLLAKTMKHRHRHHLHQEEEESWAEC
ncbi:putative transcription factor interactor and regulator Znf-B family [Helianthus annuus]|nr:putative transcription factor interactor and regulator Znf-B family [Helianthus annuus]